MVLALGVTLTVLLQCILCYTPVSPFKVELIPKKPLFRVGDRQKLTCRTSKCSEKMTFSWSSLEDKPLYAEPQTSSTESTLVFKSVSKNNENKIQCKATCQGMIKQAAVTVRVYSFPKVPVISGHDSLVLGKENSLTCEVSDVYPAEHMTVEWLRGGKVVHTQEGEYGFESIQSYYTFTPQTNDDGESITCRATLSLDGLSPEERTRETTVSMAVLCPPMNTVISVSPNNPKENEFMNISCVSDSNLASRLVLSKMLDRKETELVSGDGPRVSVSYDKANLNHSGVYVCRTTNACGRQTDNVTFTVAISSFKVELIPKMPLFRVGDRQELTCRMSKCSEKMTFSWSSLEDKPLYAEPQTSSTESTLVFKSVSKNNENMIQCKATCQGMIKQAAVTVRVYSFPKVPVISGHDSLVLGKENSLTCEVSDVYPAEHMTVEWLRGGKVVHTQEGEYGIESIQSYYTFTPQTNDDGESITCRATLSLDGLSPEERTRETTVSMAVLCPPMNTVISVSPNNPKENEFMNISCVSDSNLASRLVLSKMLDGKETELVSGDGPRVSVSYDKANLNHSGVYVCRTTNACGGQTDNVTFTVAISIFKVELIPKMPLFRVGDRQELTCQTSKCSEKMTFSWSSLEDKPLYAEPQTSSTESTLVFKSVSKNNENKIQCKATCQGMIKQAAVTVRVYSFPKVPVISGHDSLVLGKENSLTCEVSDVYPVEHMTVEWLRGGKVVHTQEGEHGIESIQSYYTFTPQTNDDGASITCRATLSLDDLSPEERTRETTVSMAVLFSSFKVELIPKKPLFRVGDRQKLTCRPSKCSEKMTFSWSSLEDKPLYAEPQTSSAESTLVFKSVSKNNENMIQCKATCQGMIKQAAVTVRVYSFPKVPVISGHDSLVLGKENSLTCEVSDVYPAEHMTVEWLRGRKVVHTQEGEYGIESIQSYYTFTPQTNDDGESITCRATLSLDDLPPEERTRETTVSMAVLCPPMNTVISVSPNHPKENEFMNISCVSDSNLASRLVLSKMLDGKETELVSGDGPRVSVSYDKANLNHSGVYVCRTTNACGGQTDNVTFTVATHPLEVSLQPDMSVIPVERGSSMTLSCNSSGCPHAHITWHNVTHQPLLSWNDTRAFVSQLGPWTVGLEDNRTFICEINCGSVVKSKHTELKVYSFPSDPTIESSGPFMEGKVTNLTCTVREVFPVDCFHIQWLDGELELHSVRGNFSDKLQNLSLTIPFKPKDSDQNKTFTCKVSLEMEGVSTQKTASTTLTVHYSPKHTTIDVRPSKKLNEGETVTISCQTDSAPEGHVTLSRVQNGEETKVVSSNGTQTSFSISFTKVSHSGTYVCEAVNKYGHQRKSVQITVQAPPKNITVMVYPSKEIQEGETVKICCQLVSFPPSDITLRKLDNGNAIYSANGIFLLANLTSNDSGLYQVNATNALGSETEIFTIIVMSKKKDGGNIYLDLLRRLNSINFIIPVIGLGILATIASSVDYIRRAKRKGFYELTEGIPETV